MVMEYWITGGMISMAKIDFTKEILRKDSVLRLLLKDSSGGGPIVKHPAVEESDNGVVNINFKDIHDLKLDQDPKELLDILKQRYGARINGKLSIKSIYMTFNQLNYYQIDLD